MTVEEAIAILQKIKPIPRRVDSKSTTHILKTIALDMAIQALEQEPVIDKIRAEIEQLRLHKTQFLTNDNKVCIDSQEVLNIIDKYKAESEDK